MLGFPFIFKQLSEQLSERLSKQLSFRWVLSGVLLFSLSSCGSLHYLFQATQGQLSLATHAHPISEVIEDEKTPPRVRKLLAEIGPIKRFGESNGIKPTKNYMDYVKLNRNAAVWVVSACEPLRFKSKEWSFPLAGSFPFLGWFDLEDAKQFAEELKKEGWDVNLRGASAYSTLGWFKDAVLSTMLPSGDEALGELVNVVLHESVHATLYIKGQSYFDESLASFVADHLTLTYLDQIRGPDSAEKKAYLAVEERGRVIEKRLHEGYGELEKVYSSSLSDAQKLEAKQKILSRLKEDLKFKREINNATLIQYKTYNTGQQDFEKLLQACNGNWVRFLETLKKLDTDSFSKPQQNDLAPLLDSLAKSGCSER